MTRATLISILFLLLVSLPQIAGAEGVSVDEHTTSMDQRIILHAVADTLDTRCLGSAGLTNSTGPDVGWSRAFDYLLGNRIHRLAADATYDLSAVSPGISLANATSARVVFHVDAEGTVNATAGKAVPWTQNASAPYPDSLAEGFCPFGAVRLVNTSDSDFQLGTTNFNAPGISAVFEDLSALPSQAIGR
jgi:hypothetical protein